MSRSHLLATDDHNQLAQTKDGYCLYNRHDRFIGRAIEKYGEFSALEAELFRQLCGPGDVVIEVGANIGAHTVGLARQVGRQGRVLAFEPQRLVFQTLCANVAINSLTNVDCHLAALGAQAGTIAVPEVDPDRSNSFGSLSLIGAEGGRQVPCLTLDHFLSLRRLKLIKIDVEGMEADVLRGGRQLIETFRPILYVENDRWQNSAALMQQIAELGYRMYWHTPPLFNPDNFYGDPEDIFPGILSMNMLCIHREAPWLVAGTTEITDFAAHPAR